MANYCDILLTVDFDRTLTAPDSTIPQRNLEAIRFFMEQGGAFTVNTGRSIPMCVKNIIGKVPVNAPLLLYNGSAAYDSVAGKLHRTHELPVEPRAFLEDLLARFPDMHIELQGVDAHYLFRKDAGWEAFTDNNNCRWAYASLEEIPQPFMKVALNGRFRENTVASMYGATEEEKVRFDEAVAYIEKTYGEAVDVFRACARIIDIHAKGCNKLRSARLLQQDLGKKILICVGDAENDLTMLNGADYAYCPSDGVIADRFENVCKCADGTVADVIYEKIPEILAKEP